MKRRLAVLKLPLVFSLLMLWAVPAPPIASQDQSLTGWFSFTVTDYPSESGLAAETTYTLTEDLGEHHTLLIDIALMQPLGGPATLNRKRVTVEGEWEYDPARFRVHFIELAPSPSTVSPGGRVAPDVSPDEPPLPAASPVATTNSAVRGSQAWVTILCRFADATVVTPHPVSFYEGVMGASYPGLEHYWKEVSDGNILDLAGSVVVGWYNLPQPYSYYRSVLEDGRASLETDKAMKDCTAAADADVFFPDFDGINLAFNHSASDVSASRGGSVWLTLDGQTRFWGVTWMTPSGQLDQHVWAHEMGHAMGLLHSSGPYDETYDSHWDVMGGWATFLFPHPEYGAVPIHTIAYHKDFLGWIPPDRKYVAAPNSTQTITLERLAQPGAEGYLMAQIPIGSSETDFYTVEARLFAGYDEGIPDEAIVIHKVDTTLEDRPAQVVDVDNNGDPNDEGAMWTVGEIFTDAENNLQIAIDAAYASGYRVTINTDPDTFSTCIDFLAASSHLFGPGRDSASVQVKAANECDWSATSNTEWIRVTSGGTGSGAGSVRYTVAANPSPAVQTGTLTIGGWTLTVTQAGANEVLFEDDMERGANGWSGDVSWARTTVSARSGMYAWTDSPGGDYQNDINTGLWSPWPPLDLTEIDSATLTFWHRHAFASGDTGNVWVCLENGDCTHLKSFTGSQIEWHLATIDLSPFVGEHIRLSFQVLSDAAETADGWYIDDVVVSATDFVSPVTLENPRAGSFQSGVGVISGWACHAHEIVIELDGMPFKASYGTERESAVERRCGHSNAGFSLLWNWNNLGAGPHTVRALIDGVEFASTTVRVTTFGEDPFPQGWSGMFDLPDFPASGETTVVQWEESLQNFVITDGQPNTGGGYNRVSGIDAILENPSLGSAQSGLGVISGWACEAEEIVIELNGRPLQAAYGTEREAAVERRCGHSDAGFSLLWNWNNLGPGTHTVRALIDGQEFANTTVRVTTFGVPFRQGLSGTFPISDFPGPGETKRLRWEQSLQNFVIIP